MSSRVLTGIVVSTKMEKTVVVKISRVKKHRRYQKSFTVHKKYLVDVGEFEVKEGNLVIIQGSSPKSKRKNWIIKEILK